MNGLMPLRHEAMPDNVMRVFITLSTSVRK